LKIKPSPERTKFWMVKGVRVSKECFVDDLTCTGRVLGDVIPYLMQLQTHELRSIIMYHTIIPASQGAEQEAERRCQGCDLLMSYEGLAAGPDTHQDQSEGSMQPEEGC
jgi:hypoxanthine phosphoribosyltransferase